MRTHAIVLALAVLAGLGNVGCSKQLRHTILPNQPPTVRLTWAPIDTQSEVFFIYKLNWVGYDPDGRVVGFEYAVNPPRLPGGEVDWTWPGVQRTSNNEATIRFECATPESLFLESAAPRSEDFQEFAIRAVDDGGVFSEPVERAFYAYGVAPFVQILAPMPQVLLTTRVTPAVRITWEGRDFTDPYGYAFERPVYYKYKLFKREGPADPKWAVWTTSAQGPDSLRREFAPEFAGWDSIGSETPEVQFTNLMTDGEYLFVVVAFGRSGGYSPIFGLKRNMLRFIVGFAGRGGPRITLFNSFFQYTYKGGSYSLDPANAIQVQGPAGVAVTFNWTAEPPEGSIMRRYRWVLDLMALDDETPRTDQNDWYHWSPWSLGTAATVGPFAGSEGDTGNVHNFYLEAEDINGLVSLGWVQFRIYRPAFDKDLLIVNDTRFQVDAVAKIQPLGRTDSLGAPSGPWPSSAELDTFLFAVGGVPWKMKPMGRLSPQGIFRGYSYDTLGTRMGQSIPTIPLGLLGHYQRIIWMTNMAQSYDQPPNSSTLPQQTLFYMSGRNRQNTLSTWVNQGGNLWALGGGFAGATNKPWNNPTNDANQIVTYRYDGVGPDLLPGQFMFDLAHWRSEFRVYGPAFVRFSRYDQQDPTVVSPAPAPAWPGGTFTTDERLKAAYTKLPTALRFRTPTSDPVSLWPSRFGPDYYIGNKTAGGIQGVYVEFLCGESRILELLPAVTDSNKIVERSSLDSLYLVYGPTYLDQFNQSRDGEGVNAVMTYYHGRDISAPLIFSGMSIWDFQRTDCQALVDVVLQDLWGLHKTPLYTAPRAMASSFARQVAVPTLQPPRRPPGQGRQPVGQGRQPVGTSTSQRWR
jgi:hypothetical protein